MSSLPPLPADHVVTASDFVRHFGLWQERATRTPLYILQRGRPRFVLISIETMNALCAPQASQASTDIARNAALDAAVLLDNVRDLILIADCERAIVACSRTARAHFGRIATPGTPIEAITPPPSRPLLVETVRRVAASGIGEQMQAVSAAREGRTLALNIQPVGEGIGVFAEDITPPATP